MPTRKYIAYGSNLNVEQMKYRCPGAAVLTTGVIKDHQLLFKGSRSGNYLTIEPNKGYEVPVVIWEVTAQDEENLDHYEGWPTFYRKETVQVETAGGIVDDAFAYIMNGHVSGAPTRRYLETCLEGYAEFGFDEQVLYTAVIDSIGGAPY